MPLLSSPLLIGQAGESLQPGVAMTTLSTPLCGEQGVGTWLPVRAPDGAIGWVSESDAANYLVSQVNSQ